MRRVAASGEALVEKDAQVINEVVAVAVQCAATKFATVGG